MTMDADWKLIQERTFLRWVNSHLKSVGTSVENFEEDFSDGLTLFPTAYRFPLCYGGGGEIHPPS